MAKVIIQTIQNLDNPPTAVSQLNYNFVALQTIIDTLLSRDGKTPNSMLANLDMNGKRILNLPVPLSPTEPARHGDIQQYVDQAEAAAERAEDEADRAEAEADDAEQSAIEAEAALFDFMSRYLGGHATPPTVDGNGNPLVSGIIYFDTTTGLLNVYSIDEVMVDLDDVFVGADRVLVSQWIALPINTLNSMSDVDTSDLEIGSILEWSGLNWVAVPGASTKDVVSVTASRSLTLDDVGNYLRCNSGSAIAITVPSGAGFEVGDVIELRRVGTGPVSVVAGVGVTVNSAETLFLRKTHSTAALIKVATNTWDLTGDLALEE